MSSFDAAIKVVLVHEGGYVNNPSDPGGATNFGISLRFLADHPDEGDFNDDGHVDIHDIMNMTKDEAVALYKEFWWDKYGYANIPDETVATKVLDFSINMGSVRAHKLLQEALNSAFSLKLTVDGLLGPASFAILAAVANNDEQKLITAYCDRAWAFYQSLVATNPKFEVFKNGWKNRAYSISVANSVVEG